jgi:hypothetical protein
MNDPSNLTDICTRYLSNYLLPVVANQNVYIRELSCLSPRLGNLLLETLIKSKRLNSSDSTDCFLSLFNNIGQKNRTK